MYSILRNDQLRRQFAADARTLLTTQVLSLLPALAITQIFFHWKSFLLEFAGFLAVWFVIDWIVASLGKAIGRGAAPKGKGG